MNYKPDDRQQLLWMKNRNGSSQWEKSKHDINNSREHRKLSPDKRPNQRSRITVAEQSQKETETYKRKDPASLSDGWRWCLLQIAYTRAYLICVKGRASRRPLSHGDQTGPANGVSNRQPWYAKQVSWKRQNKTAAENQRRTMCVAWNQ